MTTSFARLIVLACLAALAWAGLASAEPGWDAHGQGRHADAVALLREAAARGDAEAQFGLGAAYESSQGVPADLAAACRWYGSAAGAGHVAAAFNAAVLHDNGRCGPREATTAARWYARAAAASFPQAQLALAQMYAAGDGVPRNPDQATAWYRAAAANGVSAAAGRTAPAGARAGSGPVLPVAPTDPDGGQALPGGVPVALAWFAPAQPAPARFFVEVVAVEPSGPREVLARYVDVSAVQVQLPPEPARYAWRVLSVTSRPADYAISPWRAFSVAGRP